MGQCNNAKGRKRKLHKPEKIVKSIEEKRQRYPSFLERRRKAIRGSKLHIGLSTGDPWPAFQSKAASMRGSLGVSSVSSWHQSQHQIHRQQILQGRHPQLLPTKPLSKLAYNLGKLICMLFHLLFKEDGRKCLTVKSRMETGS